MMNLDMFWMTNPEWYEIKERPDGTLYDELKPNAPPEAKASYTHYLAQIANVAHIKTSNLQHII